MRCTLFIALTLLSSAAYAQSSSPITLEKAMSSPDWIGQPVENFWWSWDEKNAYYTLRRDNSDIRDTWKQSLDSTAGQRLDGAALSDTDGSRQLLDHSGKRIAFIRNGDVFVRELDTGRLTQLSKTSAQESRPQWSDDGALVWRSDNNWFRWTAQQGVAQAPEIKTEDDPAKETLSEFSERQLRYSSTLQRLKDRKDQVRKQDEQWRRSDASRIATATYLGKDVVIEDSALSPNGQWMLVVTRDKSADEGQAGKMPMYVTQSGYEEFKEVRTRVGRNDPVAHKAWLIDLVNAQADEIKFDTLPDISKDPLAELRKKAGKEALKGTRPIRIESDGDSSTASIRWNTQGNEVAFLVRAVDNKDRWLVSIDTSSKSSLKLRHHLHDAAWINWNYNEFDWMPDNKNLWLLSEESGYSHLYITEGMRTRAVTSGNWEVSSPTLSTDGSNFFFICNRQWPGDYELCTIPARGGDIRELTSLDGVEEYRLSPRNQQILLKYSASYLPPQLAIMQRDGSHLKKLTDTRTAEFKHMQWIQPEYVQVPSKHGAGTIWGKYYGPKQLQAGKQYPIVMFVHGAGYLQNVSARYTNYFREQMFHNLLVNEGYIVLDLDYRASEGYGRNWRTAIYRNMGHPELDDYLDGLDWLVENKQGNRDRAGIYGGSYGGFMTFMALYRSPGTFKAGAALRPVTDWSQYNHPYTANILNTPDIDPEAYKRSSPMEYVDGFQDHLLIAHGMQDDNVFYRDSVMMAQRLIELRQKNWELASYPLEAHGYVHPESWYDQYRRIHELFSRTLK